MVVLFALVILIGGVVFLTVVNVVPPALPYTHTLDLRAVAQPVPVAAAPAQNTATAPADEAPAGVE